MSRSLETRFKHVGLRLEESFTISRTTVNRAAVVLVEIEDDEGRVGIGCATPSSRYGETIATVEAVLPDLLAVVEDVGDPHQLARIERALEATVKRNPSAKAAVSIALHDLLTKQLEMPLYRYWGLDPTPTCETAYTVGIDTPETVAEKTERALEQGYRTLKCKLGTDRDRDAELVETIRTVAPDARLFVDANGAWSPKETLERLEMLNAADVALIEQPVPAGDLDGLAAVTERSPIPIAADESCETLTDIPRLVGACDVINIKLMKCGGLREAHRMITTAHAHGLEVMGGCMLESNASIAAACHLTPRLEYVDLDGALLLTGDPVDGIPMPGGMIDLSTVEQGTGAVWRRE